ncbi:MAG: hypothetical protein PHN69_05350 [Candidatus Pacebacteria bacterium]|nr:hypothetical protein [Candidatus Paceibacterota bacterium]
MAKRSTKFYRKNEAEVMESLGLTPTKNSGAGWVEKSDGQSEHIICELKSTDAQSYRIRLEDLHTLEYNASVCHKIPVFAVQFLGTKEVYLLVKPESLSEAAKYLETGEYTTANEFVGVDLTEHEELKPKTTKSIKSSSSAREQFNREKEQGFRKERKSAT